MTGPDYPIEHFRMMTEIADRLKEIPVQLLSHEYLYESFGSWLFVYQRGGKKYRITLDGRDYFLTLEKAAAEFDSGIKNSGKWVKEWETVTYKAIERGLDDMVNEVISLISSQEK